MMTTETATPLLTVTVAGHPPSQNARLHHMTRYRVNRMWRDEVAWKVKAARLGRVWDKVRVQATFQHRRKSFADVDNLTASLKPLLDGLVVGGLVVDDSPEHLELMPVVQVVGDRRAVTLDVWAVEDGDA